MIGLIIGHALGIEQVTGAAVGMAMIMQGVRRGMFSNEAGMGSAPNAAATAAVSHPAKQGLAQAFSAYVDTLFVCTMTGLMILATNSFNVLGPDERYPANSKGGATCTEAVHDSRPMPIGKLAPLAWLMN